VRRALSLLTLMVALCSIVYELIFSQALTVLFGQTVTRYSMTIGLYLFCLGVGSFLFSRVEASRTRVVFYCVELALCVIGPLGALGIFLINSLSIDVLLEPAGQSVLLVVCHFPIVLVGLLSGLELPLLVRLFSGSQRAFHHVLGMDYLGSLVGAVLFALWLYPGLGLVAAALWVGFVNAVAAVTFFAVTWPRRRIGLAINVLALTGYAALVVGSGTLSDGISRHYLAADIKHRMWGLGYVVDSVDVVEQFHEVPAGRDLQCGDAIVG